MKMSLGQMIAICCILAVGFMTAAPFVQTADAHGNAHQYDVTIDIILLAECQNCGAWTAYNIGTITTTFTHPDGQNHVTGGSAYYYGTTGSCSSCPYEVC